jgi:hypothetical protein
MILTSSTGLKLVVGKPYQNYIFPEECVVILGIRKIQGEYHIKYQCMHMPEVIDEIPVENFEDWYGEP